MTCVAQWVAEEGVGAEHLVLNEGPNGHSKSWIQLVDATSGRIIRDLI